MTRFLLGALALLLTIPAQAQWAEDLGPARDAIETQAPPSEGIQVHGKWTVTVRESDGSLVEETVFQNALTQSGASVIVALLLAERTHEAWYVNTQLNDATTPCEDSNGLPKMCSLVEPAGNGAASAESTSLVAEAFEANGDAFPDGLLLSGSFTAERDGAISSVSTGEQHASGTTPFTSKALTTPIDVDAGQVISIRVEITFE